MYTLLFILVGVIGLIALIATFLIGFEQDKTIKQYQQARNSDELRQQRSRQYETQSLKQNVPVLVIIYGITFVITILATALYFYFR